MKLYSVKWQKIREYFHAYRDEVAATTTLSNVLYAPSDVTKLATVKLQHGCTIRREWHNAGSWRATESREGGIKYRSVER